MTRKEYNDFIFTNIKEVSSISHKKRSRLTILYFDGALICMSTLERIVNTLGKDKWYIAGAESDRFFIASAYLEDFDYDMDEVITRKKWEASKNE